MGLNATGSRRSRYDRGLGADGPVQQGVRPGRIAKRAAQARCAPRTPESHYTQDIKLPVCSWVEKPGAADFGIARVAGPIHQDAARSWALADTPAPGGCGN